MYIVIQKIQGENEVRGDDGQLQATQHAKYRMVLLTDDRHPRAFGVAKSSASAVKKAAEELLGAVEWHGYPNYLGFEKVHAAAHIPTTSTAKLAEVIESLESIQSKISIPD